MIGDLSNELGEILKYEIDDPTERGLTRIACAIAYSGEKISHQIKNLGLADACTPMGAMEVISLELKRIADALNHLADQQA